MSGTPMCQVGYCDRQSDPRVPDLRCIYHSEDAGKPQADIQAVLQPRQEIVRPAPKPTQSLDCRGWIIPADVDLRGAVLNGGVDFREAAFMGSADFTGATLAAAVFNGATFNRVARFDNATFAGTRTSFSKCVFGDDCFFRGAIFEGDSFFDEKTEFGHAADFDGAHFRRQTAFLGCTFGGPVVFKDAEFDDALFGQCDFSTRAGFQRIRGRRIQFSGQTRFGGEASFTQASASDALVFSEVEFFGTTMFFATDMTRVSFHYCELSGLLLGGAINVDKCEFHACRWPTTGLPEEHTARGAKTTDAYRDAERIYREIRRGEENRKQYDAAAWHHARELEMRRLRYSALTPKWLGRLRSNIFSLEAGYRLLAGYGYSRRRPLLWLAAFILLIYPYLFAWSGVTLGATSFHLAPVTNPAAAMSAWLTLVAFSASTAALLPPPPDAMLSPLASLVAVSLRLAGPLLAFLFSLGIRNHFRR